MIRTAKFSKLAWAIAPLLLPALASAQDEAKPTPRERSVRVTEGRVTVVDDAPGSGDDKGGQKAGQEQKAGRRTPQAPKAPPRVSGYYGPRQEGKPAGPANNSLQAKLGLEVAEADDALRSQLDLPSGQGAVVIRVMPEGAADRSGLKVNDVIVSVGDIKVRGVNQLRGQLAVGKGPIEVKLIRAGKPVRLDLAGPEHGAGFVPEATEFWIGVPITPVDAALRSQLPDLPADAGLIANDVVAESPAAQAGVKKNDILVKLGDKTLKDAAGLVAQVQEAGDKPTPLELIRAGKSTTVTITPARRARSATFYAAAEFPTGAGHSFSFSLPRQGVAITDPGLQEAWVKEIHKLATETAGKAGEKPLDIHLEMLTSRAKAGADEASSKLEASMKELKASMEELKKAVESLKKPEAK